MIHFLRLIITPLGDRILSLQGIEKWSKSTYIKVLLA